MGLTIEACKEKYEFLNNENFYSNVSSQKDVLMSSSGPNNFVLIENTSSKNHSRMYYQHWLNPNKEAELYQWRNLTNKPVVKIDCVDLLPAKHHQYLSGFVYTEHLTKTLATISELHLSDAIYLLKTTLCGYEAIFRVLGFVSVDFSSCGINEAGECRVWVNSNFSKNIPEPRTPTFKRESQIVHEVLRLFRSMTLDSYECFYIGLQKHLDLVGSATFKEVQFFIDGYAQKNNINITRLTSHRIPIRSFRDNNATSLQSHRNTENEESLNRREKGKTLSSYKTCTTTTDQTNLFFTKDHRRRGLVQSNIASNQTERKSKKRASVFVTPVQQRQSEIPKFLSKRNVNSPKSIQRLVKKQQNSNCNISFDSETFSQRSSNVASHNNFAGIQKGSPRKKSNRKQSIDLSCHLQSIHHILAEIAEKNEENELQEGRPLRKISKVHQSAMTRKSGHNILCHQFSINIINDCSDYRSHDQKKMKHSLLSTSKSIMDSNSKKSSPHKYTGSMFWDSKRKKQPYISQFVHAFDRSFADTPIQKCNSADRKHNFGGIVLDLSEETATPEHNTDFINQDSFSFRNSGDYSKVNCHRRRNTRKAEEQHEKMSKEVKAKQQEIIMANSWKKTIENLVGGPQEVAMNKSISYGDEIPSAPVKLERLSKIGREIASSFIPIPQYQ